MHVRAPRNHEITRYPEYRGGDNRVSSSRPHRGWGLKMYKTGAFWLMAFTLIVLMAFFSLHAHGVNWG
jgi:hypothetical protein